MHSHNFYEINIVIEGTGTHYIENNSFPTQTGDVFVIPPNLSHGYSEDNGRKLKILHILLSSRFMLDFAYILKGINGYSLLFNIEPQLRKNSNIKLFTSIRNAEFVYYLHEIKKLISFCEGDMTDGVNETNKNVKVLNLICDLATTLTSNNISLPEETTVNINELLHVLSYRPTLYQVSCFRSSCFILCSRLFIYRFLLWIDEQTHFILFAYSHNRRTIERVVFTYRKDLWKNKRFSLTQKGFILTFLLFYGII